MTSSSRRFLDALLGFGYTGGPRARPASKEGIMKVSNSLKTLKTRHKDCQVVRRRGRVYVICKTNPRFKARQGSCKKK